MCKALDTDHLTSWPDITSNLVRKYTPQLAAMVQGHLNQVHQNTRSTQDPPPIGRLPTPPAPTAGHNTMIPPTPPSTSTRTCTNAMFAEYFSVTSKIFIDQTDYFPHTSTAENNNMLVLYDFNSKYVHVKAMPSQTGYQILQAYKHANKILSARSLHPRLQRLNNESFRILVAFINDKGVNYQLIPAHYHH